MDLTNKNLLVEKVLEWHLIETIIRVLFEE